jgi:hypothetical protein
MKKYYVILLSIIFSVSIAIGTSLVVQQAHKYYVKDQTTANKVSIESPVLGSSYSMTLPTSNGSSGQYLQNNGSGVLSWQTVATNYANQSLSNLTNPTAINQDLIPSGTKALGNSTDKWNAGHFLSSILYGSTSGSLTLQAANITSSYSLKFPSAQGSLNQTLVNDGSGNLSWGAGGGGGGTPGGSDGQVQYNNGGVFGGSLLYFDDVNSRVGLNTTAPTTLLDVQSDLDGGANLNLQSAFTGGEGGQIDFRTSDGTNTSPTNSSSKVLGDIFFRGYGGGAFRSGALIRAGQTGAYTSNTVPGQIEFYVGDGTNNLLNAVTINSLGNLISNGQGTFKTPNASTTGGVQVRQPTGDGSPSYLQFTNNAATVQLGVIGAEAAGNLKLYNASTNGFLNISEGTSNFELKKNTAQSTLQIYSGAAATQSGIEIGTGGSGNRVSQIDLTGDDFYTDYGLRFLRNAGQNASSDIIHRGTGRFNITSSEQSDLVLRTATADRFTISGSTGRISANNIHNNASGCSGASYFCSGTFTPTVTCVTNCTTPVAFSGMYSRVGNVVTVGWRANANNASAAVTVFSVSLPIASNFTAETDLNGSGGSDVGSVSPSSRCVADGTNDRAHCSFIDNAIGGHAFGGTFIYIVQ